MPRMPLTAGIPVSAGFCLALLCLISGCAHFVESQAIGQFTDALAEKDLQALRSTTSPEFGQRALRATAALDDIEILRLPKGEPTIVSVKDESEHEKLVTVTVGKLERKVFYRLARADEKSDWQVDDVYLRQRKDGVKVDRSVAEQMDLLLNVREFLSTWDSGNREMALSAVTPEFAEVLQELPPSQLDHLMKATLKGYSEKAKLRPKAQLDSDVAIVTLPRPTGKMILNFKLLDNGWKVSDAAIESRQDKEHIPSLKKTAIAMQTVTRFLKGYREQDHELLTVATHPKFYQNALSVGDLKSVALPTESLINMDYYVKLEGRQADFVIEQPERVVRLSMSRPTDEDGETSSVDYRVNEVTLYEQDRGSASLQEKRLSVVFTGQAIFQLFHESLRDGNLDMVRKTSSSNFNERVWNKVSQSDLISMTPPVMKAPATRIVSSEYAGAITKLRVEQAGLKLTYLLHDYLGDVRVDDIQLTTANEVISMKDTFEVLLPVRAFAKALSTGDMEKLQRLSSRDLNRLIWSQADGVPEVGTSATRHLLAGMQKFEQVGKDQLLVTLGDEKFGAKVLLIDENSQRVIDDIVIIKGIQPEERALLKRTMRLQLAYQLENSNPANPEVDTQLADKPDAPAAPAILTADQTKPATPVTPTPVAEAIQDPEVQPAGFERAARPIDRLPSAEQFQSLPGVDTLPGQPQDLTPRRNIPVLQPAEDAFENPAELQRDQPAVRDLTPSPFAGSPHAGMPLRPKPAPPAGSAPVDCKECQTIGP